MQSLPSRSIFTNSSPGSEITLLETAKRWSTGELLSAIGAGAPQSLLDTEHGQLIALRRAWRLTASRWSSPAERAAILAELESRAATVLSPATLEQLTQRIRSLLAHYFRTDDPITVQALVLDDWISALEGAPFWSIDGACKDWLGDPETARLKPLPADIKARLRHVEQAEPEPARGYRSFNADQTPGQGPPDPEREARLKAEIEEMLAQMKRRAKEERAARQSVSSELLQRCQAPDDAATTARLLRAVEERNLTNRAP